MKILIAVDGSVFTRKMVAYLIGHPELLASDCELTVLTVIPEMSPRVRALLDQDDTQQHYQQEAREILDPAVNELKKVYDKVEAVWKVGPEGQVIADHAEDGNYELIVMGSHGRSAVGKLIMGSIATKVLARCEIPMLLVR